MHTDSYYKTGFRHLVCEDFILDGAAYDGTRFVILSDGCSTREMSDVGSRILALEAMKMIQDYGWGFFDLQDVFLHISRNSIDYMKRVGSFREELFATLIILAANREEVRILGMGDGGFFIIPSKASNRKPGMYHETRYSTINFEENYPIYPIYFHFRDMGIPKTNLRIREMVSLDSGERIRSEDPWDLKPTFDQSYLTSDIKFIGIFSDGLESFLDPEGNDVSLKEVLTELNQFKIFRGEFMKRRMGSFIKQTKKLGWRHHDDLSIGGIYLGG